MNKIWYLLSGNSYLMGNTTLTQTYCDLIYRQVINRIRAQRKKGLTPTDKLRESTAATVTHNSDLEGCV